MAKCLKSPLCRDSQMSSLQHSTIENLKDDKEVTDAWNSLEVSKEVFKKPDNDWIQGSQE